MMMGFTQGKDHSNLAPPLYVDGKSIPEFLLRRVDIQRDQRAYLVKTGGKYRPVSWDQVYRKVVKLSAFLREQGVGPADRVGILSGTKLEWSIADFATLGLGAITVPIYQSASVEEIEYVYTHSGVKIVFVEDSNLAKKLSEVFQRTGRAVPVIYFQTPDKKPWDGPATPVFNFETVTSGPITPDDEDHFRRSALAVEPDAPASIVYTSGTTGQPKGAVLLHSCFTSELRGTAALVKITQHDTSLAFLPFAHVLGRVESFMGLYTGMTIAFAENISTMPADMMEAKPTFLASVPRIYEKIYSKILAEAEKLPAFQKRLFYWSLDVGKEYADLKSARKAIPLKLAVKFRAADAIVFSKIRQKFGGQMRVAIAGGAPMAAELTRFFFAAGVPILEGYGLTETTAAITCNRLDDYGFGSVGLPIPGMEVRIAADGEILLRGPMVFHEYYNNAEATEAVFTPDKWFMTGDIGEFNAAGHLRITDRKKELIVTSGGKNIAPQKLEGLLKQNPWISNAMVYGDKQKYLVALVTLNNSAVKAWFREQQMDVPQEWSNSPQVQNLVSQSVKKLNETVASYESLKKFRIVDEDFSIENGQLTPSLKLKRKIITHAYGQHLRDMYGQDGVGI